ncbi:uncharacterized protein B0H18DRAFT_888684 [Fomitopsis serialis]|uniref:uncharacterized protein n=1 Tax=Fomitopsis serialis TaxID=139415 RepID=UPI00200892BE|nr:uncharacterized protein B0H18DRAFT_888684 [Neoantrodia serialis]KAH9913228.1 hypothetical protein B0H18DRAFT_888684 [Neoantrodia serialis]
MLDIRDGLRKYRDRVPEDVGAPGSWSVQGGDAGETSDPASKEVLDEAAGQQLSGGCFCGQASYTFSATDVLRTAYCHCTQCQKLTGCPFIHTIHLRSSAVSFALPSSAATAPTLSSTICASEIELNSLPHVLRAYNTPLKPHKTRLRCTTCGTCVASMNSLTGTTSVWGVHLARSPSGRICEWDKVKPTAHIFYGTQLVDIKDVLGKWSGYENNSDRLDV